MAIVCTTSPNHSSTDGVDENTPAHAHNDQHDHCKDHDHHDHPKSSTITTAPNRQHRPPSCLFLVPSQQSLKLWTWAVFLTTVLTCASSIVTSVWLMLDCRLKLQGMRVVLGKNNSSKYCTDLGLHVLFACTVLLLAVFGLSCIGRKMTGYAMLIISGVAIFQSTMTLVFNECNTGVKDDFMTSMSTSLGACRLGSINPPFELMTLRQSVTGGRGLETRNRDDDDGDDDKSDDDNNVMRILMDAYNKKNTAGKKSPPPSPSPGRWFLQKVPTDKRKDDDFLVKQMMLNLSASLSNSSRVADSGLACDKTSAYISVLSRFVSDDDVNTCVKLCHAYQDVCNNELYSLPDPHPDLRRQHDHHTFLDAMLTLTPGNGLSKKSTTEKLFRQNHEPKSSRDFKTSENEANEIEIDKDVTRDRGSSSRRQQGGGRGDENEAHHFDNEVRSCGTKMWRKVRQFCFYDNAIFMTLSLGGPILYLALSLAFMFLGHCHKMLQGEPSSTLSSSRGNNKSMTSLIPTTSVVETMATTTRRRSTLQPGNTVGQKHSVNSLIFGSSQQLPPAYQALTSAATLTTTATTQPPGAATNPDSHTVKVTSSSPAIPRLDVFNERMTSCRGRENHEGCADDIHNHNESGSTHPHETRGSIPRFSCHSYYDGEDADDEDESERSGTFISISNSVTVCQSLSPTLPSPFATTRYLHHDLAYLRVPSSSMTSNLTTELYITDSE